MNILKWLEIWYLQQCDDNWEHNCGVEIETLDNPGWAIKIAIKDTDLEIKKFKRKEIERGQDDWIHCWIENNKFNAACGPENLEEALEIFRKWALA